MHTDVRRFKPDPVPEEHVREMVEQALAETMPGREQGAWQVVAVSDPERIGRMRDAVAAAFDGMERWLAQRRRFGPQAFQLLSVIFPEEVVRTRNPFEQMKAASLYFADAPLVLAVAVAPPPRAHGSLMRKMMRKKGMAPSGPPGEGRSAGPAGATPLGIRMAWRDFAAAGRMLVRALSARVGRWMGSGFRQHGPFSGAGRQAPPFDAIRQVVEARPDVQRLGAALQNLALAAQARGYAVGWMTTPLVARAELEQILELPPPGQLMALVALGRPDEAPTPAPRRSLDGVLGFRR